MQASVCAKFVRILIWHKKSSQAGLVYRYPILAKWKTTIQMIAIGFLLAGPAGDKILPYTTQIGLGLLWVAAVITLYTGYDYFRAGLRHVIE